MKTDKAFVVTDDNVAPLYLDKLTASLKTEKIDVQTFIFPNGEQSKSAETYIKLLNCLAENKIHRTDTLIALGGGVVGDAVVYQRAPRAFDAAGPTGAPSEIGVLSRPQYQGLQLKGLAKHTVHDILL